MSERKDAHIKLALDARVSERPSFAKELFYEPLLAESSAKPLKTNFLGYELTPFFVSSMTGGAKNSKEINTRLARMCAKFKFGMGLGSCRPLLTNDENFNDFNLRPILKDVPLAMNLGIYQVYELIRENKLSKIDELMKRLEADFLFVHVNPLQELTQPEGDMFLEAPYITLSKLCEKAKFKIGVKEVGQGFGPVSLKKLHDLPIDVIEFSSFGGTNFTNLELRRQKEEKSAIRDSLFDLSYLGHTPVEMMDFIEKLPKGKAQYIISGGIKTPLYAHYLSLKFKRPHLIGMASEFLKHALISEECLFEFAQTLIETKKLLNSCVFLKKG